MIKNLLPLLAATATALSGSAAFAAEQTYHKGPQWNVVLINDDAATPEAPYCAIRSRSWATQYISYEAPLLRVDHVGEALRVRKNGWKLPVGEETPVLVGLTSFPLNAELIAKAVDEHVLYAKFDLHTATERSFMFGDIFNRVFNEASSAGLIVRFQGNENPWLIDKVNGFEAYEIKSAFADCKSALIAMGPTLYGAEAGSDAETGSSTPFGKPAASVEDMNKEANDAANETMKWFLEKGGGSANFSGMRTGPNE
jgi:hypothetical protein